VDLSKKVQFQGPKAPGALCFAIICEGGVGAPEAHDAKVLVDMGPGIPMFKRLRGNSAVRSSRAPKVAPNGYAQRILHLNDFPKGR